MKRATLLYSLAIMLIFSIMPNFGCHQESSFKWKDVPYYPNADLQRIRTWATSPEEGVAWSKVEWLYYLTGDSDSQVADFYKNQMLDKGWSDASTTNSMVKISWYYYFKLALYVDMSHLQNWYVYTKNDAKESAMIWVTLKEVKPQPDKNYIDIGGKSFQTSFIVLRAS